MCEADDIIKHEKTGDHRFSVQARSGKKEFQNAVIKANSKEQESILAALRIVYYQAKNNISNLQFNEIRTLCSLNGCGALAGLAVNARASYTHSDSFYGFLKAICKVIKDELLAKVKVVPWIAIILDETTDVSVEKSLIIYIKFVCNGKSETHFLQLVLLESCSAEDIFNVVCQVLRDNDIDLSKVVACATDGASVMVGCKNGVTQKIKATNKHLIGIHCVAHRLNLASSQAADKIKELTEFQEILDAVYKYFHCSTVHAAKLKHIQSILEASCLQFKQPIKTRWLSFHGSVKALLSNIDALVLCLVSDKDSGNFTAAGILKCIANLKFLYITHMMADVLDV